MCAGIVSTHLLLLLRFIFCVLRIFDEISGEREIPQQVRRYRVRACKLGDVGCAHDLDYQDIRLTYYYMCVLILVYVCSHATIDMPS